MGFDKAYGAVLGAFVGDAAGAVLEFRPRPNLAKVQAAMKMPGGGVFRVGPGQITDDSELALCLAQGLVDSRYGEQQGAVATKYVQWLESNPFDIAGAYTRNRGGSNAEVASAMVINSAGVNMASKANGALMRITPLAVWGHKLSQHDLIAAAVADAQLTHPNKVCLDCNACYCIAIAHLINKPEDASGAVKAAEDWAKAYAVGEVQQWLADSASDGSADDCIDLIGFVKWAFTYAFRHLRRQTPYDKAITDILLLGGDTDTNAAIVGGLIGALHGADAIPEEMKAPVLARDANSPGVQRAPFLATDSLPSLCQQLYDTAPVRNQN